MKLPAAMCIMHGVRKVRLRFYILRYILLLSSIALGSCNSNDSSHTEDQNKSDTTAVIRLLFDSAFSRGNLPDISYLRQHNPFGDSIIFLTDSSWEGSNFYKLFPTDLDDIKLKFIPKSEICALATRFVFTDSVPFPNFLEIPSFKRTDTGYVVYLQNTCVSPDFQNRDATKCTFGFLCGGGIVMTIRKQGEHFIGKIDGGWSD